MINLKTIQKLWDESDTPMPSKWNELFQVSEQLLKERDEALERLKQAEEKAGAFREVAKILELLRFNGVKLDVDEQAQRIIEQRNQSKEGTK